MGKLEIGLDELWVLLRSANPALPEHAWDAETIVRDPAFGAPEVEMDGATFLVINYPEKKERQG